MSASVELHIGVTVSNMRLFHIISSSRSPARKVKLIRRSSSKYRLRRRAGNSTVADFSLNLMGFEEVMIRSDAFHWNLGIECAVVVNFDRLCRRSLLKLLVII